MVTTEAVTMQWKEADIDDVTLTLYCTKVLLYSSECFSNANANRRPRLSVNSTVTFDLMLLYERTRQLNTTVSPSDNSESDVVTFSNVTSEMNYTLHYNRPNGKRLSVNSFVSQANSLVIVNVHFAHCSLSITSMFKMLTKSKPV